MSKERASERRARHQAALDAATDVARERARERARLVAATLALIEQGEPKRKAEAIVAKGTEYSETSIRRWRKAVKGYPKNEWTALLLDAYSAPPGKDIDAELWALFKANYLRGSKPDFATCYRNTLDIAERRGATLPSLKTMIRRFRAEVPRTVEVLARDGERALARLFPAQERDRSEFAALEAVN
ncbi:MAG TPA: DNA-binding domain-containing protein, partial [Polyangiaceae bacterium]|nr:DNA-binding domain-containing protein [Polyangiaceae bacterium]